MRGVILQTPYLMKNGECMEYGIPSPYDEQLEILLRGRTPADLSILPTGLPDGLSSKLLFYADVVAKHYKSFKP